MVSVIIPVYNEEKTIGECLTSLSFQTYQDFEVIVIDDGSVDKSKIKVQSAKPQFKTQNLRILSQKHLGPAVARNRGAKYAKGEILVFIDADMTFNKDFIDKLVKPIARGEVKGTFTKEEYVSNWDNIWARCWNYNQGIFENKRIPKSDPGTSPVFRAIIRSEYEEAGGFDPIGFTDDWTLSRKLGYKADCANGAICYHHNPDTLIDVYNQARWVGKNEFMTRSLMRKLGNLTRFNPCVQFLRGIYLTLKTFEPACMLFQITFSVAVSKSILLSFLGEQKNK